MNSEKRDAWFSALECELQRGASPNEALVRATVFVANVYDIGPQRCEHGVADGEWCEPCNEESKAARKENGNE